MPSVRVILDYSGEFFFLQKCGPALQVLLRYRNSWHTINIPHKFNLLNCFHLSVVSITSQPGNVLKKKAAAKLYIERNLYEDFCRDGASMLRC